MKTFRYILGFLICLMPAIAHGGQGINPPPISDIAYSVEWNGKIRPQSANSLYDILVTLGGGATVALDNLAGVAINTSLISDTALTDSLGSEATPWLKGWFGSEIAFEGSTDDAFQTTFSITDPTVIDKTITFPNFTGQVVMDATAATDIEGTGLSIAAGTLNWAAALNGLSDATISGAAVDQVLRYNGVAWINAAEAVSGPGPGIVFYMDDTEIIGTGANNDNPVATLEKNPITTAEDQDDISCTAGTSPLQEKSYLYDTALGGTTIDAGEWDFDTYATVSGVNGGRVSSITRVLYHVVVDASTVTTSGAGTTRTATAAAGTPFVSGDANASNVAAGYLQTPQGLYQITVFTSGTVVTIATPNGYSNEVGVAFNTWKNKFSINTGTITSVDPAIALYNTKSAQAVIAIVATDKLAETVFAVCNNTTTVSYTHNGSTRYSHFHSPLSTRHNDLAGLQGGSANERYHMTSTQHTRATSLNGSVGITDDSVMEVDGSPNSGEYARFTANGLEGRTEGEFKGDFSLAIGTDVQAWDADLDTYAGITPSANIQSFLGAATYDAAADLLLDNNSLAPSGGTWDESNIALTLPNNITLGILDTHNSALRTAGTGNDDWFYLLALEDDKDGSWAPTIRAVAEDSDTEQPYMLFGQADGTDWMKINHAGAVTFGGSADFTPPNDSIDAAHISSVVVSAYFSPGTPDGTQCDDAASVQINSGPWQFTIKCADSDTSTIIGHMVMPDSWDVTADVTFEHEYIQTAADTDVLNGDIAIQCRGAAETVNNTWGTEIAIDDAAVTGSNAVDHTTSAAVDTNSGGGADDCSAGDTLYWRYQVDAGGTTTAVATLHNAGFKMEYTSSVGD